MKVIDKKVSHAFGKDIFLIGKLKTGEYIWLEKAKWDCDWYWGFGYIESYTNNKYPHLSKDISCHQHWSNFIGKQENYNSEKQCWELSRDYIHHLWDNPNIEELTFTEKESWELADLMQSFYTLQKTAEMYHLGNSHLTTVKDCDLKNKEAYDRINKVELPKVFERIYQILTPKQ